MKIKLLIIFLVASLSSLCGQEGNARYFVTFESTWSQSTHPHPSGALPSNAHWSRLVGAIHNDQVSFLTMGELASPGIENIAELGDNTVFNTEVNTAITAGHANVYLDFDALNSNIGETGGTFEITSSHPEVTLLAMIAPSPDWIIAIHGVSLRNDAEEWVEEITLNLYPYDAGTDDGTDYNSENADTDPAQPISSLQGITPFSGEPVGAITFILDEVLSVNTNLSQEKNELFPNPTTGIVTLKTSQGLTKITLFDNAGKLLTSQKSYGKLHRLDFKHLADGIYFLKMETNNSPVIRKLIKY